MQGTTIQKNQVGFHSSVARYFSTRDLKTCLDVLSVCFTFGAKFTSRRRTDCNFCLSKIAGQPSVGFLLELNWMSNRTISINTKSWKLDNALEVIDRTLLIINIYMFPLVH